MYGELQVIVHKVWLANAFCWYTAHSKQASRVIRPGLRVTTINGHINSLLTHSYSRRTLLPMPPAAILFVQNPKPDDKSASTKASHVTVILLRGCMTFFSYVSSICKSIFGPIRRVSTYSPREMANLFSHEPCVMWYTIKSPCTDEHSRDLPFTLWLIYQSKNAR